MLASPTGSRVLDDTPSLEACRERLAPAAAWSIATDGESFAYTEGGSRAEIVNSLEATIGPQWNAGDLGGASDPLGRAFHHGVEVAQKQAVEAQLDAIRDAVHEATIELIDHHAAAVGRLEVTIQQLAAAYTETATAAADAAVELEAAAAALEAAALPALDQAAPTSERLIGGALRLNERSAAVAERLPPAHVRPTGPNLAGSLDLARAEAYPRISGALDVAISREAAKLEAARRDGRMSGAIAGRAAAALDQAKRFAASGSEGGSEIVQALVNDARSLRCVAEGRMDMAEVTTLSEEGQLAQEPQAADASLPDNSVLRMTASFTAAVAGGRADLQRAEPTIEARPGDAASAGQTVLSTAGAVFDVAEATWFEGMLAEAQALLGVGRELIDIALAWTPGVGLARDVCEVITGRDLITGEVLSDFERFAAAAGVITGGFGSKVLNGVDAVRRVARQNKEVIRALLSRAERLVSRATPAGLNPRFIERSVATKIVNRHTPLGRSNNFPPHNGIFLPTENIEELALDAWRYGVRRPNLDVGPDGVLSIVKEYDFGRAIGYRRDTLETTSRVRVLVFPESRQFRNAFPVTID